RVAAPAPARAQGTAAQHVDDRRGEAASYVPADSERAAGARGPHTRMAHVRARRGRGAAVIDELERELASVGIRGRRRERILAEFADHLACDPGAQLGDPRELAAEVANHLAGDSARPTA